MFIGRTYLSAKICFSFETTVKTGEDKMEDIRTLWSLN